MEDSAMEGISRCKSPSLVSSPLSQKPKFHCFPTTKGGEPPQFHRKNIDEQNGSEKNGHGNPYDGSAHNDSAEYSFWVNSREDTKRDGETDDNKRSAENKFKGGGSLSEDDLSYRFFKEKRSTQVPMNCIFEKPSVLDEKGVIEAKLVSYDGPFLWGNTLPYNFSDWVAKIVLYGKTDKADNYHDYHRLGDAPDSKREHKPSSMMKKEDVFLPSLYDYALGAAHFDSILPSNRQNKESS